MARDKRGLPGLFKRAILDDRRRDHLSGNCSTGFDVVAVPDIVQFYPRIFFVLNLCFQTGADRVELALFGNFQCRAGDSLDYAGNVSCFDEGFCAGAAIGRDTAGDDEDGQ